MRGDIRKLALAILNEQEAAGKYINLALSSHSADGLSREERASLTALVYTAVERRITYDYIISAVSKRDISKLDPYTKNILRLGICQIVSMRSIPDFAAVNETVKLARNSGERSFVNGVLRAIARLKDNLPLPPEEKNYRRYLSVKYSFPLWIVKRLDTLFGREDTERLLAIFNGEGYTDLTINSTKISPEKFAANLRECGIEIIENHDTPLSIRIPHSVNPEKLLGFAEGHFFVQDRASLLSATALSPKRGETVIDCCACPGGKSFASAILMGDEGAVHSFDLHGSKLSLITSGAERLGLSSITVDERDATRPDESLLGRADKVICDAPCSGLGVLGKKADLRYKDPESIKELPELQYEILTASSKYLKVGGELCYSTCTLLPEENGEVVSRFLAEHGDFEAVDFSVGSLHSEGGCLTLLPHIHNTDGFFISKVRRIK
ncbi:MAG: 16S rRNA (cytosine(967)-C(5))-methyltransferase RsmB [Clostridia bacterium]|nr:16S rRNA (cytosine(967)-C(5))-methyltransferase RsmB [Clostridia bacterium]